MRELFFNEKPVDAILCLRRKKAEIYGSILSDEIETTYAHTIKIINKLQESGMIEKKKQGRKQKLILTEYGKKVADSLQEADNSICQRDI